MIVWNILCKWMHQNVSIKNYLIFAKACSLSSRSLVRVVFSALNLSISVSSSVSLSLSTWDGTVFPVKEQPDASHLSCIHVTEVNNYHTPVKKKKIKKIKWYYFRVVGLQKISTIQITQKWHFKALCTIYSSTSDIEYIYHLRRTKYILGTGMWRASRQAREIKWRYKGQASNRSVYDCKFVQVLFTKSAHTHHWCEIYCRGW